MPDDYEHYICDQLRKKYPHHTYNTDEDYLFHILRNQQSGLPLKEDDRELLFQSLLYFRDVALSQKKPSAIDYLDYLGQIGEDIVTGRVGMVSSVVFDAYGCVQAILTPRAKEDGTVPEPFWIDVKRINLSNIDRVFPKPDFKKYAQGDENGPAEKPLP